MFSYLLHAHSCVTLSVRTVVNRDRPIWILWGWC